MIDSEVKNFFFRLQNEKSDNYVETPSQIITKTYADILYDKGIIADYELTFFEKEINGKNIKINGFSYDENNSQLDILATKTNQENDIKSLGLSELNILAQEACNYFIQSKKDLYKKINKSEEIYDISKKLSNTESPIKKLRVFILTDYLCDKKISLQSIPQVSNEFYLFDLNKIYQTSIGGSDQTNIEIDFINFDNKTRCMLAHKTKDIISYMAFIPAEILANIYNTWGQRILNLNVRSFLQLTGKINKGMKETLIESPDKFFSYNNGISVVVDGLETGKDNEGLFIKKAYGFQIVNGGQTTATISRTEKIDGVDLSKVMVPAKITIVQKNLFQEVVPKISVYANTQNSVKTADFSSNHEFHHKVKKLSESTITPTGKKWFYERMRGEYQLQKMKQKDLGPDKKSSFNELSPANMKFTKEELAKYIICWDFSEPHIACRGAQKNFIQFMTYVNGRKFKPLYDEDFFKSCCSKSILFYETSKIIKANKKIEGYRSQILNFTISLMSNYSNGIIDHEIIWQDNSLSKNLLNLIDKWSFKTYNLIQKKASGNVSEWCKSMKSTDYLLDCNFETKDHILEFTKKGGIKKYYSKIDTKNITILKNISVEDWKILSDWCRETDKVDTHLSHLVLTFFAKAENKWKIEPTQKAVSEVMVAIKIAQEDGII